MRQAIATVLGLMLAGVAWAQPQGCPHDANSDGRVDIEDLYHLTQNPADINGDGVTDAEDTRCLEAYLRCIELLDMSFRPGEPAADGNVPFASYRQSETAGGLEQSLRVIRDPSPDGITCISQAWTTTLVGTRPGLAGPVEVRLDRDGFLWRPLWADATAASPSDQHRRGMLTCEGSAVEYVAATTTMAVGSADESRALVLLDGMHINDTAMLKGIADPASRTIGGGLLDAYVDGDGNITLPNRGMLVCFELDPVSQSDAAFAFDDVVLLVDTECGDASDDTPQEIVLRDSIGPDASMTEGQFEFFNFADVSAFGNIGFVLFPVSGSQNGVEVVEIEMVLSQISPFEIEWANVTFKLCVWSSLQAAENDNLAGDLVSRPVSLTATPPPLINGTLEDSYLATFDLRSQGIQVPPGATYWVAIYHSNGTLPDPGFVGIKESTETGETDWAFFSAGDLLPIVDQVGTQSGRAGIRITGVSGP